MISFCSLYGQAPDSIPIDRQTEQLIENISEAHDGADLDYSDLSEELNYYLDHPININDANAEVLMRVLMLTDFQVYNIKAYIAATGELVSLYELNNIQGFDLQTIYRILPYVMVAPSVSEYRINLKEVLKFGHQQLFLRYNQAIESSVGYGDATDSLLSVNPNARYLGTPQKYYTRYSFNYHNKIRFGITAEKDPGEPFFKGVQKMGFDFYSAHLFFKDFGVIKSLAIGDYQVQFGQGLILWNGFSTGKGTVSNQQKNPVGIKPFTSADENNYMRGVATTLGYEHCKLTLFYSSHNKDANIGDTLNGEESFISSVLEAGYHRTTAECADRHALRETLFGTHLEYKNEQFKIGGAYAKSLYNLDLIRAVSPYNQYDFHGKSNQNLGLDYSCMFHSTSLFGETAVSGNGAMASLNGVALRPDPLLNISLIHRFYQKEYQSIMAAAFGENSENRNEHGLYLGASLILATTLTVDAYTDVFSFPWLKYRVDAPSNGTDYQIQLNFTPSQNTQMYIRYRETNKMINNSMESLLNEVVANHKNSFRFHILYNPIRNLTMKNRLEVATVKSEVMGVDCGYLAYQDVGYVFARVPLSLSCRFAIFNTDSYETRLYAYENDLLYVYSVPAYYYKGTRSYLLLKYGLNKSIDLWFRISQTWYYDRETIGSGLDEISGKTKTDVHMQLRLKL